MIVKIPFKNQKSVFCNLYRNHSGDLVPIFNHLESQLSSTPVVDCDESYLYAIKDNDIFSMLTISNKLKMRVKPINFYQYGNEVGVTFLVGDDITLPETINITYQNQGAGIKNCSADEIALYARLWIIISIGFVYDWFFR